MPPAKRKCIIRVDGEALTLTAFEDVARREPAVPVSLGRGVARRMARSEALLRKLVARKRTIYGINTGFGRLADVRIGPHEMRRLQRNLILSHAAGVGPPCSREEVRGMMLLRLNLLAKGHAGVRIELAERLIGFLNADVCPVVPRRGSVGASGDLAPMAHIALALIGEGHVTMAGRRTTARRAHAHLGLKPLQLGAKEGLALINGVQASTTLLALALADTVRLIEAADAVGAFTALAIGARREAFDDRLWRVRPHPGHRAAAQRIRGCLSGCGRRPAKDMRVQDPYCVRCMPQVHGAARDVISGTGKTCEIEMNAATDNPILFPEDGDVVAGGNFHGAPIGHAADQLTIAVTDLAAIAERRIALLMDAAFTGATPFLTPARGEGLHSGLMMWQVTAAALVSEMKTLSHPASVDTIPTSLGQEDHVSMSMWATVKLRKVVEHWRTVMAIELLAAWRAASLAGRLPRKGLLGTLADRMRRHHPPSFDDAVLGGIVEGTEQLLAELGARGTR